MQKMTFVTYVKEALSPGGTPTRYLLWVRVILLVQALASVLPSPYFYEETFNLSHFLLSFIVLSCILVQFYRSDQQKIMAAYVLYIVGLLLSTISISYEITPLSGIVYMLTWAMTLFIAERREYISFNLVTLFMVLMLIATVILLIHNPSMGSENSIYILSTGAIFTAINIYLIYADFGFERNFYQASRKTYTNLEELSSKLSDILTSNDDLKELLWQVTEECVPFLELEECVIYLYDEEKDRLVQVAAYGNKSSKGHNIVQPIDIKPGQGIVGQAFKQGKIQNVQETKRNPYYIVDDAERKSELAVPIISNGKIIGVIDSEHSKNGFFIDRHEQAFQIIAAFCGIKIIEFNSKKLIKQSEDAKIEASHYKELDKIKNRFITNISHDLKTPLSLIKAPAMQINKISKDENVKKYADYILKNTEHLLRVVSQLLQLNRVDQGLNQLYVDQVNIEHLINKLAIQYKGLADKDKIKFKYQANPAIIMTDTFRLEQIIHNLVHNAFRYTGKNGKVELSALVDKNVLKITVSDNGPGIADDLQKKVFDRFFKADENNHEGTGIGLSLVKEYTNSLQGSVELKSIEGEGTTFEVLIPTIPASEIEPAEKEISSIPELANDGKPMMLVVEDHSDLNDFICSYFDDEFNCIPAFDGEEALLKLKEQAPDIIISDLMMPKMDGSTFVQKVKSSDLYGHIPIVVLSAKTKTESRIDLYKIGADNYLMKPFDNAELSAVVKNLLEQRQKIKERFHSHFLTKEITVDEETRLEPVEEKNELIDKTLIYIKEHLDDSEFSVKTMMDTLGISRNRFQKEIKEITSLTAVEFVRSVRLSEAKKLLLNKELTISEIAYSVGFNNLSYFTRSFKGEFEVLPSEWREQNL